MPYWLVHFATRRIILPLCGNVASADMEAGCLIPLTAFPTFIHRHQGNQVKCVQRSHASVFSLKPVKFAVKVAAIERYFLTWQTLRQNFFYKNTSLPERSDLTKTNRRPLPAASCRPSLLHRAYFPVPQTGASLTTGCWKEEHDCSQVR